MTVSQRTATSGTATFGATFSVTLPTGTTTNDLIVVLVANGSTTGPEAPTGWTLFSGSPWSAGSSQSLSAYYAPYSASLTLSFVNPGTSVAAWICNAYFQAGGTIAIDGTPVAASNTTSNTTLPTGAPTTSAITDDYEILVYAWSSGATISAVASGSTIDRTQANGTSVSVALGHNNTTSLGASTATTAFSQTLSAANIRKTGVGILLRGASASRRLGSLGVLVDYIPPVFVTVSATQATSVSRSFTVIPGGPTTYPITRSVSEATSASVSLFYIGGGGPITYPEVLTWTVQTTPTLRRTVTLTRATPSVSQSVSLVRGLIYGRGGAVTQATSASLRKSAGFIRGVSVAQSVTLRQAVARTRVLTQTTVATLRSTWLLTRLVTVAQAVASSTARGYKRTLTASQSTAVRIVRQMRLTRAITGNRRVSMNVSLGRIAGRVLRATVSTQPRLVRRLSVVLRAAVSQSVSLAGLPVQLRVLAAIQTRSLALGQAVTMTRAIEQGQALSLERVLGFERTLIVSTQATLLRESVQTHAVEQATAVSLAVRNVTPFYQVVLTTTVAQQVSLHTASTGKPAKHFIVRVRRADTFVAAGRSRDFVTHGRGVRFIAEERT